MAVTGILKDLLEAGVHFGHQSKRWNPKMAPYIFGEKNGIYIINLEKTVGKITQACNFIRDISAKGDITLYVGTKKQAQDIIASEAGRAGMFYVNSRWLGGMLTNFATIKKSIAKLNNITKMEQDGTFQKLTKKEASLLTKEKVKLQKNLGGIVGMDKPPSAIFIIDAKKEEIATHEARLLGIPVVAIVDTNSNPESVDYPIPGNDDAVRSIRLLTALVTDAILEGRRKYLEGRQEAIAKEEALAAEKEALASKEDIEDIADELTKKKRLQEEAGASKAKALPAKRVTKEG